MGNISHAGVVDKKKEKEIADYYGESMRIKAPNLDKTKVITLSGGNQQKVVLSKSLYAEPQIFFMDEPTRGIDVGAKHDIYLIMNRLVAEGKSIVFISSETPEVLGMSDRIMVVHEGHVTGIIDAATADQAKVMTLATGGSLV